MRTIKPAVCRVCANGCGVLIEVENERAVRLTGDPANELYHGYTCVKGRSLPGIVNGPDRLLHSQKRQPDGSFSPIPVEQAMDEIAVRLREIIDRDGPEAVASYGGTMSFTANATFMSSAFFSALGTPMQFGSMTIDQPGKLIARALQGIWMAPGQGFDDTDVALLIGANPLISFQGLPNGNPGDFLPQARKRGMELIVIDPRRSDTAKRASLFLQPKPGEDVTILAGLLHVMLEDGLCDDEFVTDNVTGLDLLRAAVKPFSPDYVARRADLRADDVVRAAHLFGEARRAYAMAGTGPSMSTARSTLVEYLVMNLVALGGYWLREGERVRNASTLLPAAPPKAQATPPWPAVDIGHKLRIRGLSNSLAGMPTAALAEEILLDGPGQVKALISCGGNPVAAWPDQLTTIAAMEKLELLVHFDIKMAATAPYADYVIAPLISIETPGTTLPNELLANMVLGMGFVDSYAQYTPPVIDPPAGSDLIEEWEFFYGLAQRMGLQLEVPTASGNENLDMAGKPTTDDLLEMMFKGGRVPLAEVKQHPHGAFFSEPAVVVQAKDPGWEGRLDVGNAYMLSDLADVLAAISSVQDGDGSGEYPFRLISRRSQQAYNSSARNVVGATSRQYNPAFMNAHDISILGLHDGDLIEIESARGRIRAIIDVDDNLRDGLLSMTHAYGDGPDRDGDVEMIGSPVNRLLSVDGEWERYSGQPIMSNVPVRVRPVNPADVQPAGATMAAN
jgi:anaerobic selenocysteine-containing dehydrogenase